MAIPDFQTFMRPVLEVMSDGSVWKTTQLINKLSDLFSLTAEERNQLLPSGTQSRMNNRVLWARNDLKNAGLLERAEDAGKGAYKITDKGLKVLETGPERITRSYLHSLDADSENPLFQSENADEQKTPKELIAEAQAMLNESLRKELLQRLKQTDPIEFEKIVLSLMEAMNYGIGSMTKQSHDGGIDGMGILKLGEVLSFRVAFQAKRYDGTVGSSIIRDFRGAMMGRADKGLIITTGVFSRDAVKEATRDGATPIDLIDGNDLAKHLKKLGLGVDVEIVEKVIINEEWFKNI